jgi:hypothetical protein
MADINLSKLVTNGMYLARIEYEKNGEAKERSIVFPQDNLGYMVLALAEALENDKYLDLDSETDTASKGQLFTELRARYLQGTYVAEGNAFLQILWVDAPEGIDKYDGGNFVEYIESQLLG